MNSTDLIKYEEKGKKQCKCRCLGVLRVLCCLYSWCVKFGVNYYSGNLKSNALLTHIFL